MRRAVTMLMTSALLLGLAACKFERHPPNLHAAAMLAFTEGLIRDDAVAVRARLTPTAAMHWSDSALTALRDSMPLMSGVTAPAPIVDSTGALQIDVSRRDGSTVVVTAMVTDTDLGPRVDSFSLTRRAPASTH